MFQITRKYIPLFFQDLASLSILKSTGLSWVYASVMLGVINLVIVTTHPWKNLRYLVSQRNVSTVDFRYRPIQQPLKILRDTILQFSTGKLVEVLNVISNLLHQPGISVYCSLWTYRDTKILCFKEHLSFYHFFSSTPILTV